ncbi:MAG: hypothetical protein ISR58_05365 [Anaerolineales bacterium]|nr:hypothetical protein [Chloroflexota bacterium]MBL6980603.1 hypothetical protein [Anaerolineales bacterium]
MNDLPLETQQVILTDAAQRDIVTARRKQLLEILWRERYLTRSGLMARAEAFLGKGCFGKSAWEDTFYRDMRLVKKAFKAAGYELVYSRSKEKSGYYLRDEPSFHPLIQRAIVGAVAEVDAKQVAITSKFQPAQRVQQGFSISNLANQVVAYRQGQREAAHG